MRIHELLQNQIYTIDEFLSFDACQNLISFSEKMSYVDAPVTMPDGSARMIKEVRNNARVMLDDEALAVQLWQTLTPVFPFVISNLIPIGLNERFRFYRYQSGERFHWHFDGNFKRNDCEKSHVTLMIYLNAGCFGGNTEFKMHDTNHSIIQVTPKVGTALLFQHHIKHRGSPVLEGVKYVLRTDVMFCEKL